MVRQDGRIIISHLSKEYSRRNRHNGAYYYSKEILKYFIPVVETDRNWITIKAGERACDHAIVFIHNNLRPERYDYLKKYKDLILVCGVPSTCDKVKHLGKTIYLPLSVDVEEVARFKRTDRKGVCYAGRRSKRKGLDVSRVYCIEDRSRGGFLRELARFEKCYAVGRTAIEAKILGLEVLPYDERFPDTELWQILDSKEAAKILNDKLKEVEE